MRPEYVELYFGRSDSRTELTERHDEFIRSYVDLQNATASVLYGREFLVLGPKGTGKSALAWYIKATESYGTHLADVRDASNLPLAEVPRLQTGQVSGPERTVVAWKFILLCNYLEILLRDQGCSIQKNNEALRIAKLLRGYGFIGDASGRALTKYATDTVSVPIPHLGQIYKRESKNNLNIYNLIPYLEQWVSEAQATVRHVLLLDGLDSIFLNDPQYDQSLYSLVQGAYQLNQKLGAQAATGSIVLLLRNDVFARISLSLPDSQKMRDDLSHDLDWRIMSGQAGTNAPLMQLVNRKAAQAHGIENVDVLGYFPSHITLGSRTGAPKRMRTFQYLLNLTRHTPRDILRLFEEIRKVEESGIYAPSGMVLRDDVIREGVVQYSTKYFVGAIRNEFAGVEGGPEAATLAISALKAVGKQTFDRNIFSKAVGEVRGTEPTLSEVNQLLTLLFFAGAIGNFVVGKETYMQFYHRRDEADIHLRGQFVLHNALIHAWNLRR
jgi:hypothetical protein